MKITQIDNVMALKPLERYKYFIKKIADFEEVWTIKDNNGDYALSDVEDNTFLSLWSAREYVESNLNCGWEDCVPIKLSLEELGDNLLPIAFENDYLINVFPVNGKSGFVVSLEEFTRDLNEELKQYE